MTELPVPSLTRSTLWWVWFVVGLAPWWLVDALAPDIAVPWSLYVVLHGYIYYAAWQLANARAKTARPDADPGSDSEEEWRTA
jgi:hypothetical protein